MAQFITYTLTAEAAAAITRYVVVPFRCVILSATAVADFEAGADTTATLTNGSTEQVAFVFDDTTTLADVVTGTISATTIFEAGSKIKIDVSDDAGSATGTITFTIMIDPTLSGVAGA